MKPNRRSYEREENEIRQEEKDGLITSHEADIAVKELWREYDDLVKETQTGRSDPFYDWED